MDKGISPLVATVLLIAFSVALGTVVMSWREEFIEKNASFVQGVVQVRSGCDAATLDVIKLSGVEQLCMKGSVVEAMVENGPDFEIYDVHARIVGSEDIAIVESVLPRPLPAGYALKLNFGIKNVGKVRQIKFVPKIKIDEQVVYCAGNAKVYENIAVCP
ncbi:MAG: hypothetical protein HY363_05710 [Candidatus Aenigmarchaeota archaeon]|nr:hypothetical protein [Candidatus Aenigmarchaeota archaeon]